MSSNDQPPQINLDQKYGALELLDIAREVAACSKAWTHQSLLSVNDSLLRLGVVEGEFHWHKHDDDDELFLVLSGRLFVDVEGQDSVELGPQQAYLVPKGRLHRTRAPERTVMLMLASQRVKPAGD